ncbi:MAG: hypothetical protein D6715_08655, partial [Calditrichaeota bacterium]
MEFNHAQTGFELTGGHALADCRSCHQDLHFAKISAQCASCHQDIHLGQLGPDCQQCHTPAGWHLQKDVLQLHAAKGFPLMGPHAIADCESCHQGQNQVEFAGTPLDCNGCHASDFLLASNPNHAKAGFSMACETCHRVQNMRWQEADYQHPAVFELRGAHQQADCNSCHTNTFAGTSQECFSCHAQDFRSAQNPDHAAFGFPTRCESCHNETQWQGAQFDHLQASGFELRGAHASILCIDCHTNNQTTGLPRDCLGCHQTDFQSTKDPDHVAGGFPTDCENCHAETSWRPANFDHDLTAFPLTGAHRALVCSACHQNNQFSGTPSDCYSCHSQNFNNTTDPNHVANNFSHDCVQCHNTS